MAASGVKAGMPCSRPDRIGGLCMTCMLAGLESCSEQVGRLSVPLLSAPAIAVRVLPALAIGDFMATGR